MCGRFVSSSSREDLVDVFSVAPEEVKTEDLGPNYNVAPTQRVYAVAEPGGRRQLGTFRWGLVPSWAKDPSVGSRMINARSEELANKPSFRSAFSRRRCLVPADGFYEWKGPKGARQPFFVHPTDGRPFALAGLWEVWRDAEGEVLRTCTICTTAANEALSWLHHRMPVVLAPDAWDVWLDPDNDDRDELAALLRPAPGERFAWHPVGTAVNSSRARGPELVEPVELPPPVAALHPPGLGRVPAEGAPGGAPNPA